MGEKKLKDDHDDEALSLDQKAPSLPNQVTSIRPHDFTEISIPPKFNNSPTISNNHTLFGKITRDELKDKGKNYDQTEVELGKTKLHVVTKSSKDNFKNDNFLDDVTDKNNIGSSNFSNVDEQDFSKINHNRLAPPDHFHDEEYTKTSFNLISSIKQFVTRKNLTTPTTTNPDETARISILNKPSVVARVRKWSWLIAGIFVITVFAIRSHFSSKLQNSATDEKSMGSSKIGDVHSQNSHQQFEDNEKKATDIDQYDGPRDSSATKLSHDESRNAYQIRGNSVNNVSVNYKVLGRGLVYNCHQRFYACTDRDNYINCRKLSMKNKSCSVQGVFDSNDQCLKSMRTRIASKFDPNSLCK